MKSLITKEYGHKLMYFQLQQTLNKIPRNERKWCLELHMEERKDCGNQCITSVYMLYLIMNIFGFSIMFYTGLWCKGNIT